MLSRCLVDRYSRTIRPDRLPEAPALIVANHGFGGIFDLNAFTMAALANRLRPTEDAQISVLTLQLAWTLGVGKYVEPAGFRPAAETLRSKRRPPATTSGHARLVTPPARGVLH